MKCSRCNGLMVYLKFYGDQDQFWGWNCIFCGEIVDPVILENREFMKKMEIRSPKEKEENKSIKN